MMHFYSIYRKIYLLIPSISAFFLDSFSSILSCEVLLILNCVYCYDPLKFEPESFSKKHIKLKIVSFLGSFYLSLFCYFNYFLFSSEYKVWFLLSFVVCAFCVKFSEHECRWNRNFNYCQALVLATLDPIPVPKEN